jgi:hypothetical protein
MSMNDQRAWVGQALPVDQSKPTITEGAVLPVAIVLLNFGRSPALGLQHRLAYDIQPSGQQLKPVYPPLTGELASNSVLQPGGKSVVGFARKERPLTRAEVDAITSRTKVLYLYGKATYTDVFERPHKTTFAYRFDPSASSWVFNDTYNAAD